MTHSRHPEDDPGWSEYAADPSQWKVPESPTTDNDLYRPEPGHSGSGGPVGPYGAMDAPWSGYDERDPNPPRESTGYDETSPYSNHLAWRYQQNPYRDDPELGGGSILSTFILGSFIGIGLLVLAVVLL